MAIDGQTSMMTAVEFSPFERTCAKALYRSKVKLVAYMPFGNVNFAIFSHYHVLAIALLTSQISTNTHCPIYVLCTAVCYMARPREG